MSTILGYWKKHNQPGCARIYPVNKDKCDYLLILISDIEEINDINASDSERIVSVRLRCDSVVSLVSVIKIKANELW